MSHNVASCFLDQECSFTYAIANEIFGAAIIDLLSQCFSRGPTSAALGISARDLAPLVACFIPDCTISGLFLIAMLAEQPDTLPGVFICRDLKSSLSERYR